MCNDYNTVQDYQHSAQYVLHYAYICVWNTQKNQNHTIYYILNKKTFKTILSPIIGHIVPM